jgi:hypothetical protein
LGAVATLGAAGTLEGFTAGSPAADSALRDMGFTMVGGIMMAVGRIIRTVGTTGITVHSIMG